MKSYASVFPLTTLLLLAASVIGLAQTAQEWDKRGDAAIEQDDLDTARACFEKAAEADPGSTESSDVYIKLGQIAFTQGNPIEAESLLREAIQLKPSNGDAYVMLVALLVRMDRTDDAFGLLTDAVAVLPEHALLRNIRGYHLLNTYKKQEEALADFTKAIELDPDLYDAYLNLGIVYMMQGRFTAAVAPFDRGRELKPDSVVITHKLGQAYMESGQSGKALPVLRTALRMAPEARKADILVDMGVAYLRQEAYQKAEKCFRASIKQNPRMWMAHGRLCELLTDQDRRGEAQTAITRALDVFPGDESFINLRNELPPKD